MRKIIICDDDPGVSEVMKIILEEKGYQIKTLLNGRGIKKKVDAFQPDLIFLDIWMPGIDGKEITKILKADPRLKRIPIILISALAEVDKIKQEIGADGYLAKPFDIEELLKIAHQYTNQK